MKLTIRLWQTALFVFVTLVAMLSLYFILLPSIKQSVATVAQSRLENNLVYLSRHLSEGFTQSGGEVAILKEARKFVEIFRVDIWIFDANRKLIFSSQALIQPGNLIDKAVKKGFLKQKFVYINLDKGILLVSRPVISKNRTVGLIILGDNGAEAIGALRAVQSGLKIAFFVALFVSAILGFAFSEAIRRQIQRLKRGAFSIAQGNFALRLKGGLVPDEIAELVKAFNVMAEKLGEAFQAIQSQQKQILTVINTMGEGVIEVGANGLINLANPSAARLLGKSVEELIGSRLEDISAYRDFIKSVNRALKGREFTSIYKYNRRVLLLHGTPIRDPQDRAVKGAVVILRDFTRQHELEQAQRDFISNASHELRTPLSSLKGYVELLVSGAKDIPETRESFLKSIEIEVNHLHRLVEDLFTLTRLDSGIGILEMGEHSIVEIAQETLAISHPLAVANKVNLQVKLNVSPLQRVICDRDRIIQVLSGFVDNALKHTPAGGNVTIFAQPGKRMMKIGVKDTGSGIPSQEISKIFNRFYRYDSRGRKERGAGLGLSIAKEIIEAHGSKIRVKSSPRKGSTFWFNLKIAG